jgi:hypothetical protein
MHKSKREYGSQVCTFDLVNDGARAGEPREPSRNECRLSADAPQTKQASRGALPGWPIE